MLHLLFHPRRTKVMVMAHKCLVKMDKAFNYRAHIILSEVQESTGCLGSCSLWVEEHYGCLEI